MIRRTLSLDLTFPALVTGLAMASGVAMGWVGLRELTAVIETGAETRMRANGTLIATMLSGGLGPAQQAALRAANADALGALLREPGPGTIDAARRALPPLDSSRLGVRVLDREGRTVLAVGEQPADPRWLGDEARVATRSRTRATLSPVLPIRGGVGFEIAAPVHARRDGESHVGWMVELRRIQGQGADAVRRLSESATLVVGQLDGGVWTDLDSVVPGPPPGIVADSVARFEGSPRGAGIGLATPIPGTPWVVWQQRALDDVHAPVRAFISRAAPLGLLMVLVAFAIVWRVSHRMTHRVVRLTERVDRMATDAAAAPAVAGAPSGDEIDRLERSFDAMFERTRRQSELEARLQQAQKLEAVGRLAGGVAHDFNNILTVVQGYAEVLRAEAPAGSRTAADLDQVARAAERATRLTRQLLAFSGRQAIQPVPLELNEVVRESHAMLRRLLPTNVDIQLDLAESVATVVADLIQVEQVIVNLAVNAADAMPQGGRLTFRTTETELDATGAPRPEAAGRYVCLAVRDTGIGMDRATLARIFEPFFTTKPQGKGTGLGLATVHGIVGQLGGRIWVYSEPGKGTTFKVYLPAASGSARPVTPAATRSAVRQAGELLVVEDDPATREVVARLLKSQGYGVRVAADGVEALALLAAGPLPLAVLSDLMMPGMDGAELSQRVRALWPGLPVVIMSGYADVELGTGPIATDVVIEKPFTIAALVAGIERAIAGSAPPGA